MLSEVTKIKHVLNIFSTLGPKYLNWAKKVIKLIKRNVINFQINLFVLFFGYVINLYFVEIFSEGYS
jgi:hypothetical protein